MTRKPRARDRLGQTLVLTVCLVGGAAPTARAAAGYVARRFDVYAVVDGGDMDVRESVQFEFQSGTFSKVSRDIQTSQTDGVEVLGASIDGLGVVPIVSQGTQVRVEWQFPATGSSTHTFTVHYRVRGLVYRELDRDVVHWRALPSEHTYRIDASRIVIHVPERDLDPPKAEAHRATLEYARAIPAGGIDIVAGPVQSNGWIVADVRVAPGRLASVQPRWRRHQDDAMRFAPRWAMAGGALFLAGLVAIVLARQGYEASSVRADETTATEAPSSLPAAIAGTLAANGRYLPHLAAATLVDLADRGVLAIHELPRKFGARSFELAQVPGSYALDAHETRVLMLAFDGAGDPVSMGRARGRLARGRRSFRAALKDDLTRRGLIDIARCDARDRTKAAGIAFLFVGMFGYLASAVFVADYGGWVFLVPLGALIAGIVGVIVGASMTPLSDEALVEAAGWRGYRATLKARASGRGEDTPPVSSRSIVYGVALGLAYQWSRFLRRHPDSAPKWFVPFGNDDGSGFAAFIGSSGAAAAGGKS